MVNPLLSLPGVYSFQELLRGRRALFNEAKIVVSFIHKKLEQSEKSQGHEVGGHEAKDQTQIYRIINPLKVLQSWYSLSYVYYIRMGKGGLKERGGLITLFNVQIIGWSYEFKCDPLVLIDLGRVRFTVKKCYASPDEISILFFCKLASVAFCCWCCCFIGMMKKEVNSF